MEKMPFHAYLEQESLHRALPAKAGTGAAVSTDWREQLPVLAGKMITLRELELVDAPSLLTMLTSEEVARFISPPPTNVEGFERFIAWAQAQRRLGEYLCFGVVPHGMSTAVGLFQIRKMESGFATAEWGFAMGSPYWGSGIFLEGGTLTVNFAVRTLGVHRLEARAALANGRGNGALRKVGAVQEGVMRRSFLRDGRYLDQVLWSILDVDWLRTHAPVGQQLEQVH